MRKRVALLPKPKGQRRLVRDSDTRGEASYLKVLKERMCTTRERIVENILTTRPHCSIPNCHGEDATEEVVLQRVQSAWCTPKY